MSDYTRFLKIWFKIQATNQKFQNGMKFSRGAQKSESFTCSINFFDHLIYIDIFYTEGLKLTNLKNLKVNSLANVELDIFSKYIYKYSN